MPTQYSTINKYATFKDMRHILENCQTFKYLHTLWVTVFPVMICRLQVPNDDVTGTSDVIG